MYFPIALWRRMFWQMKTAKDGYFQSCHLILWGLIVSVFSLRNLDFTLDIFVSLISIRISLCDFTFISWSLWFHLSTSVLLLGHFGLFDTSVGDGSICVFTWRFLLGVFELVSVISLIYVSFCDFSWWNQSLLFY